MAGTKTGGCLCKAIRYKIAADVEPTYNVICHCENCKRASGTQIFCASIYPREAITITSGQAKEYKDIDTDSTTPLSRFFCDNCGSSVYALTPAVDHIISIFSGTLDDANSWVPNKEQYMITKSHWLPDFVLESKEGVTERHQRGPLPDDKPVGSSYRG